MRQKARLLLSLTCLTCLIGVSALGIPRRLCGTPDTIGLAGEVAAQVMEGIDTSAFHTGSPRFDGEWVFGSYQMAALGLGQVILEHPEQKQALLGAMEASVAALLLPQTTSFGEAAFSESWRASLDRGVEGSGHGYLGYLNLSVSMLRLVNPESLERRGWLELHDRLTQVLAERLGASPCGVFETYPGEGYPPDMAMVAGSIALSAKARGETPFQKEVLSSYLARLQKHQIDPQSGLLYQSLHCTKGAAGYQAKGHPKGPPRSSGTAIAAYALSFVDPQISRGLHAALANTQSRSLFGFAAMKEYGPGYQGQGDIDSGPVVLGLSVSGTGFALASARLHGDQQLFEELSRTAALFGVPVGRGPGRWRYMSGGPLGNAILLAMRTASFGWTKVQPNSGVAR